MKIKSYQVGGVVYTPFGPSQQTTSSSTSDTKTEKITGTMKKEIIDVLKENGIPSDVDKFLSIANSFLNKSTSLSNMSLFGGTDDDYDLSDLIQIQKLANDVRWNKGLYDNAVKNLDTENAWGEIALDSRGYMYVANKDGNIETISAHEYYKGLDSGKYQAITNEQLMSLRERQGGMAFQSGVLSNLNKAIGMDTIYNQLRGVVEKLGTSTLQGYSSKEANDIFNGAKILMSSGPDGYYKITDEKQGRDVNKALNYLYQQLSPEMKRTLDANVAANGGNPNSLDKLEMIEMILLGHTNQKHTADFDSAATKSAELDDESKSGGSTALGEVPYLVRIGRGDGQYEMINISMRTDGVMQSGAMLAQAVNMGNMIDKNGNTLGMDSLINILQKAEAIKATRSKDITFGGQLLNDIEKNFVVYDGTSQLTDVWLPYKNVGGKITPDFEKLQAFNEWNDWVFKNPGISKVEKLNEAYKRGLDPNEMNYDSNTGSWTFKPSKMKLFLSFSAYADNDNVEFTKLTEDLTEEMPNEFGKKYKEVFNNLFEYGKTHRQKSDKKVGLRYDTVRKWDIRKGNVFIPIDSDFLAMHMSMTEYTPKSEMNRFAARSTAAQQIAYAQDNNIASLGQFR